MFEDYLCALFDVTYFCLSVCSLSYCHAPRALLSGSEYSAKSANCVYSKNLVQCTLCC